MVSPLLTVRTHSLFRAEYLLKRIVRIGSDS